MVEQLTQFQQKTENKIVKVEKKIKKKPHSDFDIPELEIKGFGHVQYDYANNQTRNTQTATADNTNNFLLGGVDLFITSKIAKHLSFLSETLIEFGDDGENIIDVERALLKYDYADWLNISIGRGHTALGYWNQRFHHGKWLFTTIDRPILYEWEDDGGILPVHFVGLQFSGNVYLENTGNLSYTTSIANGRGKTTESIQLTDDKNNDKQLSFMFTFEPEHIEGLGIGANILYDVIPENKAIAMRSNEIEEIIAGIHFFYLGENTELITEY